MFVLATAMAVLGVALTVTLVVLELAEDDGAAGTPTPSAQTQASGFILFDELHTTLLVSPGNAGRNAIDLVVARHDGSVPEDLTGVTVSVSQPGGQSLGELEATPVEGQPGTYHVSRISIPSPGDWEFGVTVETASEPLSGTTPIAIGAP